MSLFKEYFIKFVYNYFAFRSCNSKTCNFMLAIKTIVLLIYNYLAITIYNSKTCNFVAAIQNFVRLIFFVVNNSFKQKVFEVQLLIGNDKEELWEILQSIQILKCWKYKILSNTHCGTNKIVLKCVSINTTIEHLHVLLTTDM